MPPIPIPKAAQRPFPRVEATAVRATMTKLGPGLMAPIATALPMLIKVNALFILPFD